MKHRLALVAAVLLVAAGCGDDGGAGDGTTTAPPALLDGRTFLASESIGAIGGHTLVPGTAVRISFADGRVGASAGCNSMGGEYRITEGRLQVTDLAQTEMACEEPLMAQDAWLAGLLTGDPLVALSGDELTLSAEGESLTLVDRRIAEPDRPLLGTMWTVDGLITDDAVSSVPAGVVASLVIDDRSGSTTATVHTGCNQGGGPVEVRGAGSVGTIGVGPLMLSKSPCEADEGMVESVVLSTLDCEVSFSIEANRLTLRHGAFGLMLVAND